MRTRAQRSCDVEYESRVSRKRWRLDVYFDVGDGVYLALRARRRRRKNASSRDSSLHEAVAACVTRIWNPSKRLNCKMRRTDVCCGVARDSALNLARVGALNVERSSLRQ